jgi:glycosyltransferase involved in cell wall biosynthesis
MAEAAQMKRVLMLVFQFPPFSGSSAVQRSLRFVQNLPATGWSPIVLTASSMAYEEISDDLLSEIPPGTLVYRAPALDARRHLSVWGHYPKFVAMPDRWASWIASAVPKALGIVRRHRPDAIWSTYPIATTHKAARVIHQVTSLPWIADFRDPMAQEGYPPDPATWRAFSKIEKSTIEKAAFSVFTTPGAARVYRLRYPQAAERIRVIENGYDEGSFEGLPTYGQPLTPGHITILHSGVVYPSERDPTQLMKALGELSAHSPVLASRVRVRFRASHNDALLQRLAQEHGAASLIECLPAIPYKDALAEMMRADGLLILQAANCNDQIPAKIYEYIRSGRPMLGLTDQAGDTGRLLVAAGSRYLAPLSSSSDIANLLLSFIAELGCQNPAEGPTFAFTRYSRAEQARSLATLLNLACVASHAA